jgi:hypothetical protein
VTGWPCLIRVLLVGSTAPPRDEVERPLSQPFGQRQPKPRRYAKGHARTVGQQRQDIVAEHPRAGGGKADGQGALSCPVIVGQNDQPPADFDPGAMQAEIGLVLMEQCAVDVDGETAGQIDRV